MRRRSGWPARASGVWGGLALVLICLGVYLPGIASLPPVDRDESRFAQASRQMARSVDAGDWLVPMVQDRPRLNKPPLIYWLQAGAARALGGESAASTQTSGAWSDAARIWPYRVPSLIAAIIAVLATWRIGVTMFEARAGWIAGLLLAVCPVIIWESKQARADMVLLAATTVAMWMVWSLFRRRKDDGAIARPHKRWIKVPLLWFAVAAGVMTKGPITPMVVGLTVLTIGVVSRRWRWIWSMRPILGVLLVAAVLGAWVWGVAGRVGWDAYLKIVGDEVLGRSVSAKEGHWGPPGYHLVLLSVLFWPGVLLTGVAVGRALHRGIRFDGRADDGAVAAPGARAARLGWLARWRSRRGGRRDELFCLAWIVPSWIVFELVGTKLPHYTLPLYPPLALLSARALLAAAAGSMSKVECRRCKAGFVVWLLIGAGLTVGMPVGLWWAGGRVEEYLLVWWGLGASIAALAALLGAIKGLRKRRFVVVQLAGVAAMAISWPATIGLVLPGLRDVWVSREVQRQLARVDPEARRPVAAVDYHEDSLIFLTAGRVDRLNGEDLRAWIDGHPDGLVVMPIEHPTGGLRRLSEVSGFNYSKGERVRLQICDRGP